MFPDLRTRQSLKQSVTIKLAGHSLNLRTEDQPEYVHSLATYLNSRIDEIREGAGSASGHQVALLAGLQIVDELFRAKQTLADLEERVADRVGKAVSLLEQSEAG